MRNQRRRIRPNRRRFNSRSEAEREAGDQKPDILQIWEQQRQMREREAQLEQEYERTKARLRELKIKMKQQSSMLADATDLQATFSEEIGQWFATFRLWLAKLLRKGKLKVEIAYLKLRYRLKLPKTSPLSYRWEKIGLVSAAIVAIASITGFSLLPQSAPKNDATGVAGANTSAAPEIPLNQTPEFAVLKPQGKNMSALGGFAKVSPTGVAPVYAYADQLNNVKIRVSQQQLPEKFKSDASEITKLAASFNANRNVVIDGVTVYIGQSEKGPQSLIFQKDSLLVLISADQEIPDGVWAGYLANLKT